MKLYKIKQGLANENGSYLLENEDWDSFTNDDALLQEMIEKIKNLSPAQNDSNQIPAPVGSKQELWACGVY